MQIVYKTNSTLPGSIADEVESIIGVSAVSVNPTYTKAIRQAAKKFVKAVELPVETSLGTALFPLDMELVRKRITYCVNKALNDGVEVAPDEDGVYKLITSSDVRYSIMLDREEERALIRGVQDAETKGDERSACRLNNIAVTFLTSRMRPIYKSIKSVICTRSIQDDVVQEMYIALFNALLEFDLNMNTAGLSPSYLNNKMFNAARAAIMRSREMALSYRTWRVIKEFENAPEDFNMTIDEIAAKYEVSPSLAETMVSFARNGAFFLSVDYKLDDDAESSVEFTNKLVAPNNDYKVSDIYIMLDVLPPEQKAIVELKMEGYTHQEIADKLGYESKRAEQYQYSQAKIALAQALELDPNLYSGLRTMAKKMA